MIREASCRCGKLKAACRGEPARVSICHCLACKKRSGSAFSYNATYAADQVETSGESLTFERTGEEGYWARDSFCPGCGSIVFYEIQRRPGMISVPVGLFADPEFPEPRFSIYEVSRHRWLRVEPEGPIEHWG